MICNLFSDKRRFERSKGKVFDNHIGINETLDQDDGIDKIVQCFYSLRRTISKITKLRKSRTAQKISAVCSGITIGCQVHNGCDKLTKEHQLFNKSLQINSNYDIKTRWVTLELILQPTRA